MKKLFYSLFLCLFPYAISLAQTFCNDFGNVILYSNYEGGILNIEIDEYVPNIKVGICSYDAVEVNFSGAYVGNVVAVIYAGFGVENNTNCGTTTIEQVSINGVPPDIVTTYIGSAGNTAISPYLGNNIPSANVPLVNCITSGGGCLDNTNDGGGGNSSPQIVQFFLAEFGSPATLYYHYTSNTCFNGTYQLSDGGNCCLNTPTSEPNPIYMGGSQYNFMPDTAYLCNGAVTIDLSFYPLLYQPPIYTGYVWNNGQTGESITLSEAGTYWFTATDYCHAYDQYLSDTIVVLPCACFSADALVSPILCNAPNSGSISISTQPSGDYSYIWNTDPPQNTATIDNLGSGNYSVTVSDNMGCDTIIAIALNASTAVFNSPLAQTALSTCAFDTVTISYNGNTAQLSAYNWVFDGISQATGNGFYVEATSHLPDTATVLFIATNALNNCTDTLSASIVFSDCGCIYPCNDNNCSTIDQTDPETCACTFTPIVCNDNDCATTDQFDLETCACTFTPIICNDNNANTLDSFDTLSCTCRYRVPPIPQAFALPTAFSPNNDGINDLFGVWIHQSDITLLQLTIYNRWGQALFSTNQASEQWNGTYQNRLQDMGVYVCVLRYALPDGTTHSYKNNFTLIR